MKKLLALLLAFTILLMLEIPVFAADEIQIELIADNLIGSTDYFASADQLVFDNGTVMADQVEIFALKLPKNVVVGETVTVHIKESSTGDFRSWLICADQTANKGDHATFSEMWKASENGFTPGSEFDLTYTLTAADAEPVGGLEANKLCFKAFASHEVLDHLTLTYLSITYDDSIDIEAETKAVLDEIQPYIDEVAAALAEAEAASDNYDTVKAAYDKATIAMQAINNASAGKNYADVTSAVSEAKDNLNALESIYNIVAKDIESAKILEEIQSYVDTVDNAVETANNAGSDVASVEIALADAKAAHEYVVKVANDCGYTDVLAVARDLKAKVSEIEDALETSKALKAEEDAKREAEEAEAAAKAATTKKVMTVVGIVAAVVIVVVIVVVLVLKKKKK